MIYRLGHRGVLVRLAGGEWQWAAVGEARPSGASAGRVGRVFPACCRGSCAGGGRRLLVFATLIWLPLPRKWYRTALLVVGWLLWLFVAAVVPPAITNDVYADIIVSFGLIAVVVWAVLSAVVLTIALGRDGGKDVRRLALHSLWALPAYFLPYLICVVNLLPYYYLRCAGRCCLARFW